MMMKAFHEGGVSFRYPADWHLEREEADGGWTVSVHSPDTAFLVLTCDTGHPTPEDVAETTLDALRDEYPGLEAEARVETLAGQMAVGHDLHFFSFDLTNTAWTRTFSVEPGTLLVLCQATDAELETAAPVLRAITASLKVEGD